jgi:hypothetical protein
VEREAHRLSVAVEMPNSRDTVSTDALCGGNSRATALSLNACPYLANSFFRYRPRVFGSIEATTILTQRDLAKSFWRPAKRRGGRPTMQTVSAWVPLAR